MRSPAPLIAIGALLLSACSTTTLNEDECRMVDWRTLGYEDGVAGHSGERISAHRKACAEHGIRPDLDAYRAGRADGLREYCQPHNGYRAGTSGAVYYDSCPPDLAPGFVVAYESGRQLYVRERRVTDADDQIAARRGEIARLEAAAAKAPLVMISETATPEERTQALLDAKNAAERIGRMRTEIVGLEKDRVRYAQELEEYRATVANVPY